MRDTLEGSRAALKIIKKEKSQGPPQIQPLDQLRTMQMLMVDHPISSRDGNTVRRKQRGLRGGYKAKYFVEHFCSFASCAEILSMRERPFW